MELIYFYIHHREAIIRVVFLVMLLQLPLLPSPTPMLPFIATCSWLSCPFANAHTFTCALYIDNMPLFYSTVIWEKASHHVSLSHGLCVSAFVFLSFLFFFLPLFFLFFARVSLEPFEMRANFFVFGCRERLFAEWDFE